MGWLQDKSLTYSDDLPAAAQEALDFSPHCGVVYSFVNEWQIDKYTYFKPLVFLCVFGSDRQARMMSMTLSSLSEFGKYDGDILVISDKKNITDFIPPVFIDRVKVWYVRADDMLDYACARYLIAEWPEIFQYNPALYVDTDVIFDADIKHILHKIAVDSKINAQGAKSEMLLHSPGVGCEIFRAIEYPSNDRTGINTGILGFPMPLKQKDTLRLIRSAIYRYAKSLGTRAPGWYDQPTVNYVLVTQGLVNDDLLGRTVRWGGRNALHGGLRPSGLIHLWGAADKEEEMSDILTMLRGLKRNSSDDWFVYDEAWAKHRVDYLES